MLNEAGRPRYAAKSKEFADAVKKRYEDEYLAPITVGVGEKAETIAYSLKDRDAQLLAMSLDMMMPVEDDVWGALTDAAQKLADSDYSLFKAVVAPYTKTPLNAHKFHLYYSQPLPFLDATGIGAPMGILPETLVGIVVRFKSTTAVKNWQIGSLASKASCSTKTLESELKPVVVL